MPEKRAFIHIGFPKTGTTALQAFLHNLSPELVPHGVLYPETGKWWHAQHELAGIFQSIDTRLAWVKTDPQKPYLELLKNEVYTKKASTLILSSEAFAFTNKYLELKEFLHQCGFQNIKIVCFFRRQDLWAESAFTQLYKAGLVDFNFAAYASNNKQLNYFAFLEKWKGVFEGGNMIVEVLDGEIGHRDIVPAAIEIFGIQQFSKKYSPQRYNAALSPSALHYSHLAHKSKNDGLLGWLLDHLEKYTEHQTSQSKYVFMNDVERMRFLCKYDEINRQLGTRYLGRENAFSVFSGFSETVAVYPDLSEVDLTDVSDFVLSEVRKKSAEALGPEWLERERFVINQNNQLRMLRKGTSTDNRSLIRRIGDLGKWSIRRKQK